MVLAGICAALQFGAGARGPDAKPSKPSPRVQDVPTSGGFVVLVVVNGLRDP